MNNEEALPLRGDHITLDALLKASGAAVSGGEAKQLIASGAVQVNGVAETRRGRKLRSGDLVVANGRQVLVTSAAPPNDLPVSGLGL